MVWVSDVRGLGVWYKEEGVGRTVYLAFFLGGGACAGVWSWQFYSKRTHSIVREHIL